MRKIIHVAYALLLTFNPLGVSFAGIVLNNTRVIYPAQKKEVTLGLVNHSSEPRLIQVWIDNGDEHQEISDAKTPFIVTPPIFRLDSSKGQTLRVLNVSGEIPQDRESVYWINILEIKPLPSARDMGENNYIQFPVRSKLKLFYRPASLPDIPKDLISHIKWKLVKVDDVYNVKCINTTPWNVSFSNFYVLSGSEGNVKQSGMCPAKGTVLIHLGNKINLREGKIHLTMIDDYGRGRDYETSYEY